MFTRTSYFLLLSIMLTTISISAKPKNLQNKIIGTWIMAGSECGKKGKCKAPVDKIKIIVSKNKIIWQLAPGMPELNSVDLYKFIKKNAIELTDKQSKQKMTAKVIFLNKNVMLLESKDNTSVFDKWKRVKKSDNNDLSY